MGDLTQIFSSLSVGVVFLVTLSTFFVTLLIPGHRWYVFLDKIKKVASKSQESAFTSFFLTTVFIPLLYGSGLLIQDYTDYLTDRESGGIRYECDIQKIWKKEVNFLNKDTWWRIVNLSNIQRLCLGDEGELRAKSLLNEDAAKLNSLRSDKNEFTVSLNGLGRSLKYSGINVFPETKNRMCGTSNKTFIVLNDVNCDDEQTKCFNKILKNYNDKKDNKDLNVYSLSELEKEINALYYRAKNWSYRVIDNHYKELEEIQRRIDFSRSVFLVISFGLFLTLIAIMCRTACYLLVLIYRFKSNSTLIIKSDLHNIKSKYMVIFPLLIAMIFLIYITSYGYRNAERVYNERVFGYYSSYKQDLNEKRLFLQENKNGNN